MGSFFFNPKKNKVGYPSILKLLAIDYSAYVLTAPILTFTTPSRSSAIFS